MKNTWKIRLHHDDIWKWQRQSSISKQPQVDVVSDLSLLHKDLAGWLVLPLALDQTASFPGDECLQLHNVAREAIASFSQERDATAD